MSKKQMSRQKNLEVALESSVELPKSLEQLSNSEIERRRCISRVMTCVLKHLTSNFVNRWFEWLLPVIFSKSTDPLWPDPGASIEKRIEVEIYGCTVRPTLSMIVHKMIACSLAHPKLFILSPNVRIERRDRANSGVHAYEFTQLDFEVRDATSEEIRSLVEVVLRGLISAVKRNMREELVHLGRYDSLRVPGIPFRVCDRLALEEEHGKDWGAKTVYQGDDPIWVVNIPREFYDFEDFAKGTWDNYDLLLPGYGEVLSGARREWEYNKMIGKMERDGVMKENYRLLLTLAREGKLKPSAGAGIGVERVVSWIAGAKHIGETQMFPKIPGLVNEL
ncbi:MAG TPA: asparagine synthetase A [Candidatus Bathyarchaeia archaeon]|nr:asparagine synthetase A [Candidatus Bathyarchaeia archaeon]